MRKLLLVALAVVGCGSRGSENSAACGFAAMAGATMVLEQLRGGSKLLSEVPERLQGTVPARVVGYGTTPALVAESPEGPIVGYDGQGFPAAPGFGLALVEDSAETFKGVLIFDIDPPRGYPQLGMVVSGSASIPLYGMRVTWGAVSDPRCPLFAALDTAGAVAP